MSGKGDKPRPLSVSLAEYERRWQETFRRASACSFDPTCTFTSIDVCEQCSLGGVCLDGLDTMIVSDEDN